MAILTDPYWRRNTQNEGKPEPKHQLINDLHHVLPRLKFVFLLREPVSHIYWHYNNAPYGKDKKSPEDFHRRVKNSIDWWNSCTRERSHPERACVYGSPPDMEQFEDREDNSWWPKTMEFTGALRDGLYYIYIADLLTVYHRDNMLFVRADDYLADPRKILNEAVYPFLEVSPFRGSFQVSTDAKEINEKMSQEEIKPMLPETKLLLTKFYEPYNEKLASMLHDNKYLWKDITSPNYRPNTKCC